MNKVRLNLIFFNCRITNFVLTLKPKNVQELQNCKKKNVPAIVVCRIFFCNDSLLKFNLYEPRKGIFCSYLYISSIFFKILKISE